MRQYQRFVNPLIIISMLAGGLHYAMKESGIGFALGIKNSAIIAALTLEYREGVVDRSLALDFGSSGDSTECHGWSVVDGSEIVADGWSCQLSVRK